MSNRLMCNRKCGHARSDREISAYQISKQSLNSVGMDAGAGKGGRRDVLVNRRRKEGQQR